MRARDINRGNLNEIVNNNYPYNGATYEWNQEKAKENISNHGVSFETAVLVFDNEITYETLQYIDGEERLKTVAPVFG